MSACTRDDLHRLLARYEFGTVDDAERIGLESHVLDCDVCFGELERGAQAAGGMREHAAALLQSLREPAPAPETSAVAPAFGTRHRRRGWFLAPAALAAVLAGVLFVSDLRAPSPADVATFPTEAAPLEILRAPGAGDAVQELLATGAAHFDLGHYADAAKRFRAALGRDPQNALAAYMAGLSTALAGDARGAIPALEQAARLASGELRAQASWVLANAYLRAGRTTDARRALESLRAEGGPHAARAAALLERLRAFQRDDRTSRRHAAPRIALAGFVAPAADGQDSLDVARQLFEAERWDPCRKLALRIASRAAARGDAAAEMKAQLLAAECALNVALFPPAGESFAKAAECAARAGDGDGALRAREGAARVRAARGESRQAIPEFRVVLEAARAKHDRELECRALLGLGQCQHANGDRTAAIASFEAALDLARRGRWTVLESRVLQDYSQARHRRGERAAALALQEQALDAARRSGKKQEIVGASIRAALVYVDDEQYSRGMAALREALPLAVLLGHRRALLNIHARQAAIHAALGRPDEAVAEYEAALALSRDMQAKRAEGGLSRNLALVLADLGRDDAAERAFADALRISKALGNASDEGKLLHQLGEFHLARGRFAEADRLLREAVARLDSLQDPQLFGHIECLRGEVAARGGDTSEAQVLYARAEARARRHAIPDVLRDALRGDAEVHRARGDLPGADRRLAEAIEVAETVRAGLAGSEHRVGFQERSRPLHVERARVLYDLGGNAHREAFRVMEMARARVLLDALSGIDVDPEATVDPALRDRQTQALQRLHALQAELSRLESESGAAPDSLLRAHRDASRALRDVREEIAVRAPSYGALLGVTPPLGVAEVQARVLAPGQVLLEYLVGDDASHVCVVDAARFQMQRLACGEKELQDLVVAFRAAIQADDRAAFGTASKRLYELLVAPVAGALPAEARLLVVPDGPLFELPFAALHDGERFLVERHALATAPSASVLDPRLRRDAGAKPERLLAVGNPASYREDALLASARALHGWSFGELPYAEEEARRIGRHFRRKRVLVGENATEEAVKAEIGRAGVIHFATHGMLNASEPLQSGLVLAQDDDPREDGLLQVHEILALRTDADLVVLSACGSGLGRRAGGEGVLGLSRAFLHAGARRLVLSLWEVADRSTVALMDRFYAERFDAGQATDAALRAAQLERLAQGAPPRDWAAFVLTGAVEPGAQPAPLADRRP